MSTAGKNLSAHLNRTKEEIMKKLVIGIFYVLILCVSLAKSRDREHNEIKIISKKKIDISKKKNRFGIPNNELYGQTEYLMAIGEVDKATNHKITKEILNHIKEKQLEGKLGIIKEVKPYFTKISPAGNYILGTVTVGGGDEFCTYISYFTYSKEEKLINIMAGELYCVEYFYGAQLQGYVSDYGQCVSKDGNIFKFYGSKSKIIKEVTLFGNVNLEDTDSIGYPIKHEDKILLFDNEKEKSRIQLRTFTGELIWLKEFDENIETKNIIFSKNDKYFAFKEKNVVVMDIDGNIIKKLSNDSVRGVWRTEDGAISNDGKRLVTEIVRYYEISNDEKIWSGTGQVLDDVRIEENYIDSKGNEIVQYKRVGRTGKIATVDISADGSYVLVAMNQLTTQKKYGRGYIFILNKYRECLFRKRFEKEIFDVEFISEKNEIIRVIFEDEILEIDISEYL